MSRDGRKDFSTNPEVEQLLSGEARNDVSDIRVRLEPDERLSVNELYLQGGVPSSLQNKSVALNHNAYIAESSNGPTAVITPIIANGNDSNGDPPPYVTIPPPYSAIAPPDHIGWPYGLFPFGDSYSTDGTTRRMEIPLTPYQACLPPATSFHPEGINGQYAPYPMPLMPYRFFKFGCRRNSFASRETADDEIADKIEDRKSRKYGAILVAAAVIIFVMALSLMVRFIMEKSWWRR
ncbi:PREDICTED: uncharacterized protein LOC105564549 isoform X2 [Vollenhovia emeryi]|uniref:uncharacterized protein LOC105564549 isoform X2 n=1 Tax=Vollenhovia emeryi TaxID=411798 RepID=UPI0005F4AD70|nr:PREDICTED: uncharacterized protein LOC105564549 isoform X2 [Vollenhovia emeryi]